MVTSMFADIVGYTDLMQRDEALAMKKLDQFKIGLEREIPHHNGEIIQYFGDGCLAIFKSTLDAISCARKLQQQWGQLDELPVRIGLHLGDVIMKEDNVYGDSVNLASRIESMGIPNSILLSESVRTSVKNHPEFNFQLLGKYEFKNVNEPLAVYALETDDLVIPDPDRVTGKLAHKDGKRSSGKRTVLLSILALLVLVTIGYFALKPGSSTIEEIESSIAVLPFTNLSQDANQDYLTSGFTSEVNHQLSKIESLSVISQTITRQLTEQEKTASEIAKELKVNYILEGSIQKAGDRTRLITNLTRMTDNQMIWSEEFDLDEVNLIDAQIQVSTGIAEKLPLNISARKLSELKKIPTANPLAYEFYLKGLDAYNQWAPPIRFNETAIRYMEEAIRLDSNFAEAYALLAEVYSNSSVMLNSDFDQESVKSLEYANRAIELDSTLPDPYVVLGWYHNTKKPGSGLKWFAKANELDPKAGLIELSYYHRWNNEYINAFEYAALKIERDPTSPDGFIGMAGIYQDLGDSKKALAIYEDLLAQGFTQDHLIGNAINTFLIAGRPEDAIEIIDKHIMSKDSIVGTGEKGKVLFFMRNWVEAEKFYLRNNYFDMDMALIHLNTGREESAKEIFQAAIDRRLAVRTHHSWYICDLSRIYAAMGNFEKAHEYLNILDQKGDLHYSWIDIDPFFDRIRNEKRFQEYCNRISAKKANLRRQIQNMEKGT